MGFWDNVLEGLKLVRIWEDDFTFFNMQSLNEMSEVIRQKASEMEKNDEEE